MTINLTPVRNDCDLKSRTLGQKSQGLDCLDLVKKKYYKHNLEKKCVILMVSIATGMKFTFEDLRIDLDLP